LDQEARVGRERLDATRRQAGAREAELRLVERAHARVRAERDGQALPVDELQGARKLAAPFEVVAVDEERIERAGQVAEEAVGREEPDVALAVAAPLVAEVVAVARERKLRRRERLHLDLDR